VIDEIDLSSSYNRKPYFNISIAVKWVMVRVMVFNATFNNISVLSWLSVLLVEDIGVPGENHVKIGLPVVWWRQIYLINHFCCEITCLRWLNHIGCVMFSMLASSAVDCGFESRSGQTKDYKIGICCFSAKHAVLRSKSKDWLARKSE
jgi:hypothetical protein